MQEEIKNLKKQLKEAKALCKTLEEKNLRLSEEVKVLRKEKGYVTDLSEMSEDMLKVEMTRYMFAYQKFPEERRRIKKQKRQEAIATLTSMFEKAMSLDKKEGNMQEAIKAHEACLKFGHEHKDILRSEDFEKSAERIAVIYRKTKEYDKEVEFIKKILKTRKKFKQSIYSRCLYDELAYRLKRAEILAGKK